MPNVTVRVFDTESDAVDFYNLSRAGGKHAALTETANSVTLRYEQSGKTVSVKLDGDGSSFTVMAFDGPILCQGPD